MASNPDTRPELGPARVTTSGTLEFNGSGSFLLMLHIHCSVLNTTLELLVLKYNSPRLLFVAHGHARAHVVVGSSLPIQYNEKKKRNLLLNDWIAGSLASMTNVRRNMSCREMCRAAGNCCNLDLDRAECHSTRRSFPHLNDTCGGDLSAFSTVNTTAPDQSHYQFAHSFLLVK